VILDHQEHLMNNRFLSIAMVLLIGFSSLTAEAARRMGSGKSMGKQSNNVSQTQGTKPAQNATPASPASPAAAAPQRSPWGAMLGGLAVGLGLAWLASSLGFGEEFGQIIMFGLIALAIMMAVGYFMRRKAAANSGSSPGSLAYQGVSASYPAHQPTATFKSQPNTHTSNTGSMIGSAVSGFQPNWTVPDGFDVDGFLSKAKENFVTMQDAWDRSDTSSLRQMMTDNMLTEIKAQIAERDAASTIGQMSMTEVVSLDAKLLGIEESIDGYLASIEFSGMIREESNTSPESFKEIWNMSRSKQDNGGWLLAGIQGF
jgi:predicted lipid-binding transport protein (Tim44 family)